MNFKYVFASLVAAAIVTFTPAKAAADDKFAVTISPRETLQIFSPSGEMVADINPATVGKLVTMPPTSFLVSYGRDANGQLTAILSPNPEKATPLHFTTMGRTVDTDGVGVVTLNFSRSLKSVSVDPGFIGVVKVGGQPAAPTVMASAPSEAPIKKKTAATPAPAPKPVKTAAAAPAPKTEAPVVVTTMETAPATAQSAVAKSDAKDTKDAQEILDKVAVDGKLIWAEPVSNIDPEKRFPVASDEIKVGTVNGTVLVSDNRDFKNAKTATPGMVVPSGSYVKTEDGAVAGLIMGGVNSVKLTSQSEAQINQNMSGTTRDTTVDLKKGSVFSRVGKRQGETQDFKVKTPVGVAAAKGTQYAVTLGFDANGNPTATVVTKDGVVATDGAMSHVRTVTVKGMSFRVASNKPISESEAILIVAQAFEVASDSNIQFAEMFDKVRNGTATKEEKDELFAFIGFPIDVDVIAPPNDPTLNPNTPPINPKNPTTNPGTGTDGGGNGTEFTPIPTSPV